jgi:DNA modification methylase
MKLIHGDCLEKMKKMSDESVDAIIVDIPYFNVVKDDFDNQWGNKEEYLLWCNNIIAQMYRILRKSGSIMMFTGRQHNHSICLLLDTNGFIEKRIIIWSRKRGFNTTRGHALSSGYEPICYYTKSEDYTFNSIKVKVNSTRKEYTKTILKDGVSLSDVWSDIPALPHNSKEKVNHPTQKPIALMERCISLISNKGDMILDFCMGSGSTGVACLNTNRNFIGIEKDDKYFEIAKNRIKQHKSDIKNKRN